MRIDFHRRELRCRVVVFGACAVGKTTLVCTLAQQAGELAEPLRQTALDHTLSSLHFSDVAPDPVVNGLTPRFEWVTIPGPEPYPAAWRMLIQDADGIVFVADSISWRLPEAQQSLLTLRRILHDQQRALRNTPIVFAYNKQDLPGSLAPSTLDRALNTHNHPAVSMAACLGRGVDEVASMVRRDILTKLTPDLPTLPKAVA